MLFKAAKQNNSQALEADAIHFSTDILSSGVVLLGLVCSHFGYYKADAISAIGVAIIVLTISYRLGKRAIDVLLDRVPDGLTEKVEEQLKSDGDIIEFHDLKIRVAGPDTFVKVNVHINPDLDIAAAHDICDKIEQKICSKIPRCEIIVHAEPE